MTKLIPLHNRKNEVVAHTIVDDADYEWLMQWRWVGAKDPYSKSFYAIRIQNGKKIFMHKVILGISDMQGDHINTNSLDNRRVNLRPATSKQNAANRNKHRNGRQLSSQYKGVSWDKRTDKWRAKIVTQYLGYFTSEIDAARAYDAAALDRFGEFARPNFPQEHSYV